MLFMSWVSYAYAQEAQESVVVYFKKESASFEADYKDNGIRMESFFNKVRELQKVSDFVMLKVESIGTASPEGDPVFNEYISEFRQASVEKHLLDNLDIPSDIFIRRFISQDWETLAKAVEADPNVTSKDKILDIIRNGGDDRLERMLEVEYSRPYWYIYHNIFPELRACRITMVFDISAAIDDVEVEEIEDIEIPAEDDFRLLQKDTVETMKVVKANGKKVIVNSSSSDIYAAELVTAIKENRKKERRSSDRKQTIISKEKDKADGTVKIQEVQKTTDTVKTQDIVKTEDIKKVTDTEKTPKVKNKKERHDFDRQLSIKTNVIGWGLSAMNVAVEIDIAENWAFSLPFYYSGTNYFKETIKFRVATLQPEIRYYIPSAKGLYAGAHMGVGWFNFALDGPYRIQDAGGKRPAWGGGLGIGYKTQFRSNPRWGMEFALGAGVYDAKYDKFYNEPNGPYVEKGMHKTFIGIDNAAVSFTYSFDLKKKEGTK